MSKISVVIPAHNEEALIGRCLASVREAEKRLGEAVEIIVCLNRCTDNTEQIAAGFGVILQEEPEANVARVRNRGLAAASGDILVTLDADTTMSANYLREVKRLLASGRYIGGAGLMVTDRLNLASILLGLVLVLPAFLLMRFSGGMFWMTREAYAAVGGFDSGYLTGEDLQMWRALRRYARAQRQRFGLVTRAYLRTSARKMDEFGPWFMLTHPHWFYLAAKGRDKAFADRYMYRTGRTRQKNKR